MPEIYQTDPVYTRMGPALLAKQGDAVPAASPRNAGWDRLWQHLEQRMQGLYNWRLSWWQHWALLAEFILPRRYYWLVSANSMNRGMPLNQKILDPTGTQAMRICASGLMSGLTSPSRPWFNIKPRSNNVVLDHEALQWIDEVESRVYEVMAGSNFYDSIAQMYEDLVVFGTGPMIIYEDDETVIRCFNPCAGEYYLATGPSFRVESFYRTFNLTISQIVEMFGIENCTPDIQSMWQTKGANLETERTVAHAIEPAFPITDGPRMPAGMTYREAYWIKGTADSKPLSLTGYREAPFIAPRWATTANDAYGRSPAMDALPDIMQLQVMTKRKAEAIEKQVRPPLLASVELKNEPSSILPGHVTYVTQLGPGQGMRPIYEVKPELQYMTMDIQAIQTRVRSGFFNDLFLMLADTDPSKRMTATEVAERQQEKLQVLGPVIERSQSEGLSIALKRIIGIMKRRGLLPPMPKSLIGVELQIDYVSMLALAQKAAATSGMERYAAMVGSFGSVNPDAFDMVNTDEFLRTFGDMLLVPNKVIPAATDVAKKREARHAQQRQQAEMQQALTTGGALAEGAKTLSDTNVGGGRNALEMMLGGM